jgi:transposase
MATDTFQFSGLPGMTRHYCGLDVHKYELAVSIYAKDDSGHEFLKHGNFGTDAKGLEMAWGFVKKYQPVSFAMEATNVYHHVVCTFLEAKKRTAAWTFDVLIFNPADASGMPGRQKNDKVDAAWIARYLAAGLLKGGRPVTTPMEDLRAIFRAANRIETDRTAMKNRIKKTLDRAGFRPRALNLNYQWSRDLVYHLSDHDGHVKALLEGIGKQDHPLHEHETYITKYLPNLEPYLDIELSHGQKALVRQDIAELEFKSARKAFLAVEIDAIIAMRPGLRSLVHAIASVPGMSAFSAAWLVAEIETIHRFPDVNKFLAYAGCCPRVVRSASTEYSARVNKHSNRYLRTMFFSAGQVVCNLLKKDSALKRYARRTVARKGHVSKKLAISIVASKIARIVYAIFQSGCVFVAEPGSVPGMVPSAGKGFFTVTQRKDVKNARRLLRRLESMKELGILGPRAKQLADALDRALKEN